MLSAPGVNLEFLAQNESERNELIEKREVSIKIVVFQVSFRKLCINENKNMSLLNKRLRVLKISYSSLVLRVTLIW